MSVRPWYREIIRRRAFVVLLLLLQLAFLIFVLESDSLPVRILNASLRAIGICLSVYVIYKPEQTSSAACWIFLLLLFPVAGTLLYLLVHVQASSKRMAERFRMTTERTACLFSLRQDALTEACAEYPGYKNQFRYLQQHAGYPVYKGSPVTYFSPGEEFLPELMSELEKAESYIFMEYFIIADGKMWDGILDILKRKAARGVDVRVIYDDIGCFVTLPRGYSRTLESFGIKCSVFNPFRPVLSSLQNNRDHRKICSIDGKVAFTGGINLADEYANICPKYGYWKDCAIRLEGDAAWSLTVIFLQMWSLCRVEDEELEHFLPSEQSCTCADDGFIQPYASGPAFNSAAAEQVYLQIINSAKDYLYLTTPYLIIDDKMLHALVSAAQSGVDVRIITPHIYDKALVREVTRSYYRSLIDEGVHIYEFTPGYIHSKLFVSDDKLAAAGTVNLDYRSLFLHFECGALLCGSSVINDIKQDFTATLRNCHEITQDDCRVNIVVRIFRMMLRLFAPLL